MKSVAHLVVALALYSAPLTAQQQVSGVNWTVTLVPSMNPVPVGSCGAVSMTLKDSTGKDAPRTPEGWRVSIADFDMTVSSATNVVGVYNGASSWSVCACQGATAERAATVTATYPARALATKSRVAGVEGQWSVPLSIATAKTTFNPAGCSASTTAASTSTTTTALSLAPMPMASATMAPVQPAVTGVGVGAGPSNTPATMVLDGIPFSVKQRSGGSTVLGISAANGTITRVTKSYEPIIVDVSLGTPLDAWINQGWQGNASSKSGSISQLNARVPMTQLTFANASVLSTTIPTIDAGSTEVVYMRVALNPASTAEAAGVAPPPLLAGARQWLGNKFLLTIPGATTTGVTRIESFVVGRSPAVDAATGEVSYKASPGASVVPKLMVTLSEATASDWVAWLNASVSGSSTSEKSLTLDLRSASDVHLATIQGDGVGIIALRSLSAGTETIRRVQAELYVKRLQLLP